MTNDLPAEALLAETRGQIEPLLLAVLDDLDSGGNAYPMAFFTELLLQLRAAATEAELLQLFFDLSTTAFQGFVFSADEAETVDKLLAQCETIAFAMTAGDGQAH
ncbi:MAG: hypothetical protein AAGE43_18720 [Pseudomonadota bacterium]